MALVVLAFSAVAWATPRQIIIIRHGEKFGGSIPYVTPQGCERAYQLPQFFSACPDIVAIYAAQPKAAGGSIRPIETIAPTASALGLQINNSYRKSDVQALANEILSRPEYDGKTVVVCWEHKTILNLVPYLGIQLPDGIKKWPGSVFDQAWIVSYGHKKKASLAIVAEHVLPTDISNNQSGIAHWGKENPPANNGIVVPSNVVNSCAAGHSQLDALAKSVVIAPVPGM